MRVSFWFTGVHITQVSYEQQRRQSLCGGFDLSPVFAAANLFGTDLRSLLHHLGSEQVQRDPHPESARGKGHRRRRQRGEDVAATSQEQTHQIKHVRCLSWRTKRKLTSHRYQLTQSQTDSLSSPNPKDNRY